MQKLSKPARRYWQPVFFLALVNFAIFMVVNRYIGGDAVSGRVEGGRYYVSHNGVRTEVSRAVYNYSLVHSVFTWVVHGLAVGGGFVLAATGRLYEPQLEDGLLQWRPPPAADPASPPGDAVPAPRVEVRRDGEPDWLLPFWLKIALVLFGLTIFTCGMAVLSR